MDQALKAYVTGPANAATSFVQGSQTQANEDANALQSILSRLTNLRETLYNAADRYQRVCDRAFGPSPEKALGETAAPVPVGVLNLIRDQLSYIEQTSQWLHKICDRADTIV